MKLSSDQPVYIVSVSVILQFLAIGQCRGTVWGMTYLTTMLPVKNVLLFVLMNPRVLDGSMLSLVQKCGQQLKDHVT